MPNELHQRLQSLIASIGFNDGANRGFWRVQPREKVGRGKGRWIEMGAELRMFYKDQRGKTASVQGRAVGSTGTPDGVRVLVQGEEQNGVPDGIYAADTANVRVSKAVLPGEVLEEQGIENVPQIGREQEALLPTLDSLERADITDDDIRLINEGAESNEAKQHAEYKKSVEAEEQESGAAPEGRDSAADEVLKDVMADVAYGGDTDVTVDDLVENLKKATAEGEDPRKSDSTLRETRAINLEKGDVIRTRDGKEGTVLDVKFDLGQGGQSSIRVQNEDGSVSNIPIDPSRPFYVVKGKKGKPVKPAKPAKAEAKPAVEETKPEPEPEAPKTEAPAAPSAPVVSTEPENSNAPEVPADLIPEDRTDDGSEIEMPQLKSKDYVAARKKDVTPLLDADGAPKFYIDQDEKIKPAYDPSSMLQALAEVYPNSKFTADGLNLVLARMKDKDGRIFELRASNAGQKAVSLSMRWTDPNTGEIEELFHYDTRESITSLFRADNGPDGLMDKILGRNGFEVLSQGKSWKAGPDATFRERAQWFVYKQKMMSAEKMALKLANGRTTIYHTDKKNFGRIKSREVLSTWEAVEKLFSEGKSQELVDEIYFRLEAIMGSVPATDKAHKEVMTALRSEYKRLFGSRGDKDVNKVWTALVTNASMHAKGKNFSREKDAAYRANAYASADRHTPLVEGMVVSYENNVGQRSVLRVVARLDNLTVSSKDGLSSYNYKDFVQVVDANGDIHTISSKELRILKDQNAGLTPRLRDLRREELTRRRIEMGEIQDPADRQSAAPVPGFDGTLARPEIELEESILVDDLIPGDDLFDENGELIGEIIAIEPTQDNEGNDGFAFLVEDQNGEEVAVFYPQGTEIDPKKA